MYVQPNHEEMKTFFSSPQPGPVVMLNLLLFRDVADYTADPNLAPADAISGAAAYERYIEHARPFVEAAGGEILFMGAGSKFLIGPADAGWDLVLLIRQKSADAFRSFATNRDYLAGLGHRTAALADSRLMPMRER